LCGQKLDRLTVESIGDVHNARKEDLGVVKVVKRFYTINQKREQKGDTPEERGNMTLSVADPADDTKVLWTKSVRLYLTRLSDAHELDPEETPVNLTKIKGSWPVVIDREVVTKWWGPPTVKGSSLQHPSVPFSLSLSLPPSLPPSPFHVHILTPTFGVTDHVAQADVMIQMMGIPIHNIKMSAESYLGRDFYRVHAISFVD